MTSEELSEYLQISEEKIIDLVEKRVIFAYSIGGELLRFRKEQIDAIRSEIDSRLGEEGKAGVEKRAQKVREKLKVYDARGNNSTFRDQVADLVYFNDFYIISGILAIILLIIIFRG